MNQLMEKNILCNFEYCVIFYYLTVNKYFMNNYSNLCSILNFVVRCTFPSKFSTTLFYFCWETIKCYEPFTM